MNFHWLLGILTPPRATSKCTRIVHHKNSSSSASVGKETHTYNITCNILHPEAEGPVHCAETMVRRKHYSVTESGARHNVATSRSLS